MSCPSCRIAAPGGQCPACGARRDASGRWGWSRSEQPNPRGRAMADPTPRDVSRDDYEWCTECKLYIPKKFLKATSGGIFNDQKAGQKCPAGHTITPEAPASGA